MNHTDTFNYHHNFQDYSVELEIEVSVYRPRFEDVDDYPELEILKATVIEEIEGCFKKGQTFDINLLDYNEVADSYFNKD